MLALLASEMTIDEVLSDYADLERDDLLAALEFGAVAVSRHGDGTRPLDVYWS